MIDKKDLMLHIMGEIIMELKKALIYCKDTSISYSERCEVIEHLKYQLLGAERILTMLEDFPEKRKNK